MKSRGAFLAGVCALVVSATSFAHAKPVGTLSCSGSAGSVKFNVSFFTFGLDQSQNIGSQSGGAGAGKVQFQPLEVHAALSTFATLAPALNKPFESCKLTAKENDGSQTEFEFKLVAITALTAAASQAPQDGDPARFTDVQLEYGAVEVKSAGGSDDGGTTPGGWNRINNNNGGDGSGTPVTWNQTTNTAGM
jgi:hypothetical protein